MKKVLFMFVALVATMSMNAQVMKIYKGESLVATYPAATADKVVFEESQLVYEAVDLGLPSGLKWANMNVGATTPEGYGDYFAWGETEPKLEYHWSTYKLCNGSYNTLTKYCTNSSYGVVDNKTTLELEDDAAYVNLGGTWRIPTMAEWDELRNNCTWTWITQNGVKGYLVTSEKNSNSIFLPAAGFRYYSVLSGAGSNGHYWSSSLHESGSYDAYFHYFSSANVGWRNDYRYYGQSVRPVCPKD